jgi:PAS domain S-box-containing protein
LAEAEETLHAIRTGEVDTVMVAGKHGSQVFTLEGAEHAYRMLIESMNEGALMLTAKGVILYANQCFAKMAKLPLEQVLGASFHRLLSATDQAVLRPRLTRTTKAGSKVQVRLNAGDGSRIPAQISIRPLAKDAATRATIGLVVTDMTEARRAEELLRALTHRVVQVQEAERARVAHELHDNITQLLCAGLFHSQALADKLSARAEPLGKAAIKLREMLGHLAEEVERISRDLRPSVLDQIGLVAVLRETSKAFAARTGIPVNLARVQLTARLPADIELAFYRILQEALGNVEKHARARHVAVCLRPQDNAVVLTIKDDGVGFDPNHHPGTRKGGGGLGLLSMRERATYAGGTLKVKSAPHAGTEIVVLIPLPPNGK